MTEKEKENQARYAKGRAILEELDKLSKDPAAAVARGKAFIEQARNEKGSLPTQVYNIVVKLMAEKLNDFNGAVAYVDEAFRVTTEPNQIISLTNVKGTLLIDNQRGAEAAELYKAAWDKAAAKRDQQTMQRYLPGYTAALKSAGKGSDALNLMLETAKGNLGLSTTSWLFEDMTTELIVAGRGDEALSWAKLHFVECPYNESSMTRATQLLTKVWMAKDMTPAKAQLFLKSQQEAGAPNPLKDVALPQIDPQLIQRQIASLPAQGSTLKVTLLIASGDNKAAMQEAYRLIITRPTSNDGVLEVCRVFKANDLDLKRANAYLQFYKTGEGENPLSAFLKGS